MDVIEFLLKNIYIAIPALFFLYRIIFKSENKGKPSGMPTFGGEGAGQSEPNPSLEKHSMEGVRRLDDNARAGQLDHSESLDSEQNQTVYRSLIHSQQSAEGTSHEMKDADQKMYESRRQAFEVNQSSTASRSSRPSFSSLGGSTPAIARETVNGSTSTRKQLSKAQLRQAFVWSEVLGSPRSKRSYRK